MIGCNEGCISYEFKDRIDPSKGKPFLLAVSIQCVRPSCPDMDYELPCAVIALGVNKVHREFCSINCGFKKPFIGLLKAFQLNFIFLFHRNINVEVNFVKIDFESVE